jgi:ankyrin repeat protein
MNDLISTIAASNNVLLRSILVNDVARVRELLESGTDDQSSAAINPLSFAAQHGHSEIVDLLLDFGAPINFESPLKLTACLAAVGNDHEDVVRVLIRRGADLSIADYFGRTPLSTAIANSNESIVIALIEAGAPLTDLDVVCQAAALSTAVIRRLLDRQIDIAAARTSLNRTACLVAVMERRPLEVFEMLVDVARVDICASDAHGQTCMHVCAQQGRKDLLLWLLDAGADVDARDRLGDTPLHVACSSLFFHFAMQLIVAGADVKAKNDRLLTPTSLVGALGEHIDDGKELLCAVLAAGGADSPLGTASLPSAEQIDAMRRRIVAQRVVAVRERAFQVCVALRALDLDALCMSEILMRACERERKWATIARLIPFHIWWQLATAAKHHHKR